MTGTVSERVEWAREFLAENDPPTIAQVRQAVDEFTGILMSLRDFSEEHDAIAEGATVSGLVDASEFEAACDYLTHLHCALDAIVSGFSGVTVDSRHEIAGQLRAAFGSLVQVEPLACSTTEDEQSLRLGRQEEAA